MLDLSHPVRQIAGVDLAQDTSERATWYVLPAPPSVVRVDGVPDLRLLRIIEDGQLRSGDFHLRVSLAWAQEQLDEAKALLEEEAHREVTLLPLPVLSAEADIVFAGREPVSESDDTLPPFELRRYGSGQPRLDPPYSAALSTALTADGTRLVDAVMRGGGAPIGVSYRLLTEALRPGMQVTARVDWSRSYEHFSSHRRTGGFLYTEDVRELVEKLVEDKVIQISAVSTLGVDEEGGADGLQEALAWVQRALVERFCNPVMELRREPAHVSLGTVGEIFKVGHAYQVKALTQVEHAVAEMRLDVATVVRRTLLTQTHLADLLGDADPDEHIEDAEPDHPFFARHELRVRTARSLATDGVSELSADWCYGDRQITLRLTPDEPEAELSTWRDASDGSQWSLVGQVTFADDSPVHAGESMSLPPVEGHGQELTLDLAALLRLHRVEVITVPDPERVLATRVRLRQLQGEDLVEERELVFSGDQARATATFADMAPEQRIEARYGWLLAGGRLLEAAPVVLDTTILRIPPPFAGAFTVRLVSAEDWSELDRLLVSVSKVEDGPGHNLIFDGPGQLRAVALDMPDPTDRSFVYRVKRFWSDGREEEDEPVHTDVAMVMVGGTPANRLVVDFEPLGSELPVAGIHLIQIDLQYVDVPNRLRHSDQLEIRALADRPRWSVELADPTHREYEYRITTYRSSGETQVGPWTKTSERLVVVPIVAQ
ncbi:MAG: hypothetical protein KC501_21460 [Myxococcales bacterium]|nr:hypothetical protein [Myxococcales bacterium]